MEMLEEFVVDHVAFDGHISGSRQGFSELFGICDSS